MTKNCRAKRFAAGTFVGLAVGNIEGTLVGTLVGVGLITYLRLS